MQEKIKHISGFIGRKDDIINTFGFRVSPHEIERVVKTNDLVALCCFWFRY